MPFLSNFFSKKAGYDFSKIATDIHSHFIPGIDDGCKKMEESLQLMKRMSEIGFKKIVCTPHIQEEYYRNNRETIMPVFDELVEKAHREIPGIELFAAGEYLLDDGFPARITEGLLSFGKNKYVLVELSYFNPHPKYKNYLQDLLMKGYSPVMAHPERYGYWLDDDNAFIEMHDAGVELQVNIPSVCGYYGPEIRKRAFDLISKRLISCAGSDLHNEHYLAAIVAGLNSRQVQHLLSNFEFKNLQMV